MRLLCLREGVRSVRLLQSGRPAVSTVCKEKVWPEPLQREREGARGEREGEEGEGEGGEGREGEGGEGESCCSSACQSSPWLWAVATLWSIQFSCFQEDSQEVRYMSNAFPFFQQGELILLGHLRGGKLGLAFKHQGEGGYISEHFMCAICFVGNGLVP